MSNTSRSATLDERPVWQRLCEAYGVAGLADLAEKMRLPASTTKNWKSRGNVPVEYCIQAHHETGQSLDWLILGHRSESEAMGASTSKPTLTLVQGGDATVAPVGEAQIPQLLNDVLVAVLEALRRRNLVLPPDRIAELVGLIYSYEAAQLQVNPAADGPARVKSTTDRFLRAVG